MVKVSSTGVGTIVSQASTGMDGSETPAGDWLVGLDTGGSTLGTFPLTSNSLSGTNPSSLPVPGAAEIERMGSNFFVSTGANNTVRTYQVSSTGILSLVATNSVSGTPTVISADPSETYLAVNSAATGITTIYTSSSAGVLTAVASATTGVAASMILELVGKRQ